MNLYGFTIDIHQAFIILNYLCLLRRFCNTVGGSLCNTMVVYVGGHLSRNWYNLLADTHKKRHSKYGAVQMPSSMVGAKKYMGKCSERFCCDPLGPHARTVSRGSASIHTRLKPSAASQCGTTSRSHSHRGSQRSRWQRT